MVRDPYSVLGVSRDATKEEIRKAYREKARACHPDLHPDDPKATEKMQQVNEAYSMLTEPQGTRPQGASAHAGTRQRAGQQQWNTGAYRPFYTSYYNAYGASDDTSDYGRRYTVYTNPQYSRAPAPKGFLRSALRFIGGIFLLRVLFSFLRFGLFGFFF